MKQILFIVVCCCSLITVKAQQDLVADQNPNYQISQEKYMKSKDSLLAYSTATIQETYKAYDWYQARLDRRNERRENRRLNNYYYDNNYDYNGYNYGGYNSAGYNNNWWMYALRPNIGYRTGNWFFGF